jgi:hypothetical protein
MDDEAHCRRRLSKRQARPQSMQMRVAECRPGETCAALCECSAMG